MERRGAELDQQRQLEARLREQREESKKDSEWLHQEENNLVSRWRCTPRCC